MGEAKRWSKEDIQSLKEMWSEKDKWSIKDIANALNRSESAVKTKVTRLCLGQRLNYSYFTSSDLIYIFGINTKTLSRWRKYGLKARKSPLDHGEYCYTELNLYSFLKKHQRYYDSDKLKIDMLPNCPKWLKIKHENDLKNKKPKNFAKEWSVFDDSYLKRMLAAGLSNEEISKNLNRTFSAVEARIGELGLGYKRKLYWNMKEIMYVKENSPYKTIQEMSEEINRTPSAIEAICKTYNFEYHMSKNKCKNKETS